jgi:hypothetical protein
MAQYITINRPNGQITAVRSSLDLASEIPLTEHEQIINELYQKLNITNNIKCDDIEAPYFDKNGKEIKEFAVLKVYHFYGVNEQGRGRKHYYMYKWVRLKEHKGKKYWVAMHLTSDKDSNYYALRAVADNDTRKIMDAEIVS